MKKINMDCQEILLKSKKTINPFLIIGGNIFLLILMATWPQTNYSLNQNKPFLGGKH